MKFVSRRIMAVLFCSTATIASLTLVNSTIYAEEIKTRLDRPIIIALQQATDSIIEPRQQIETLAWLSEMSNNLRKRIPNEFYRVRLLQTVLDEANLMGLDPQLVLAVIDIESNFNRYAVSSVGAQGLMQVMPFWKNELGRHTDDLFNPRINIRYGCAILKHYIK
ncbi:MAG: lytic transglycosylase domain-containing protein, partial [Arenicella sp.]